MSLLEMKKTSSMILKFYFALRFVKHIVDLLYALMSVEKRLIYCLQSLASKKVGSGRSKLYSIPGAPGIGVKNPHKEKYRVFVQCNGSGHRFLKKGATVLYKVYNCSNSDII